MKIRDIIPALLITILISLSVGCMDDECMDDDNKEILNKNPPWPPNIYIISPEDGSGVSGIINISGIVYQHDNRVQLTSIEYRMNSDKWNEIDYNKNLTGDIRWSFLLDTTLYPDGSNRVYARACNDYHTEDFLNYSIEIIINNNGSS